MKTKEILFEKEVDIDVTIENIEKSGFGKKYALIRDFPPQLFDKEKSIKEIKSRLKQAYKVPRIRLVILTYIEGGRCSMVVFMRREECMETRYRSI